MPEPSRFRRPPGAFAAFLFGAMLLLLAAGAAQAQGLDNRRHRVLAWTTDSLLFDSLSVHGRSFRLLGAPPQRYRLEANRALLVWTDSATRPPPTVELWYELLPFALGTPSQLFPDSLRLPPLARGARPWVPPADPPGSGGPLGSQMSRDGGISRGISLGNRQDVVVNSRLDLQMSGPIAPNLRLDAALSDANIPIQADGTTQQLQEFDRVFVRLSSPRLQATFGDFVLEQPTGRFNRFSKKAQGSQVVLRHERLEVLGAVALARGKFNRMAINGQEGNQGPYRLRGANDEPNAVVLSGTERVYLDGKLLRRGAENDYTLNYNTGELSFTPAVPITKDSRLIVEFEYADQNYARALSQARAQWDLPRGSLWFAFSSEQDLRRQPIRQPLDSLASARLALAGDSLALATVPYVAAATDTAGLWQAAVLYRRAPRPGGLPGDSVFVHEPDPAAPGPLYRVGFTLLGAGRGNYRKAEAFANGRVFEWVEPIEGKPQGTHEPILQLVPPQLRQSVGLGASRALGRAWLAQAELSLSRRDLNTFSPLHADDDWGWAGFVEARRDSAASQGRPRWTASYSWEFQHRDHRAPEVFRPAEFARDWNLPAQAAPAHEHWLAARNQWTSAQGWRLGQQSELFVRQRESLALRNALDARWQRDGWDLMAKASQTRRADSLGRSAFFRHEWEASRMVRGYRLALLGQGEDNPWRAAEQDALLPASFRFAQWGMALEWPREQDAQRAASLSRRDDWRPDSLGRWSPSARAWNAGLRWSRPWTANHQTQLLANFRSLQPRLPNDSAAAPEQSLLARWDQTARAQSGLWRASAGLELGSGLEMSREYIFIEVSTGQGTHVWVDYDQDGAQTQDEFEVAAFPDQANFIKSLLPTDTYLRTLQSALSLGLWLEPARLWQNPDGARKWLSALSAQGSYFAQQKSLRGDWGALLARVHAPLASDTALASFAQNLRAQVALAKFNPRWGADWSWDDKAQQSLAANGRELRQAAGQSLALRANPWRALHLLGTATLGSEASQSENFARRNYDIARRSAQLDVEWRAEAARRLALSAQWQRQRDALSPTRKDQRQLALSGQWRQGARGLASLTSRWAWLRFEGDAQSPAAFVMLEGLRPGANLVLEVRAQWQISELLSLDLNYQGRYARQSPGMVHTGGLDLRALF